MPNKIPDYYAILGVGRNATPDDIRRAFHRRSKDCHPDFHPGPQAREQFVRLRAAYQVLHNPKLRARYDRDPASFAPVEETEAGRTQDPKEAERTFQKGLASLVAGDAAGAVELFSVAIHLDPNQALYYSYLGLSLAFRKGAQYRKAGEFCERGIALDPKLPDAHTNLGLVYAKAGLALRAEKALEQALALDPANKRAKQALANLKKKKPAATGLTPEHLVRD